MCAPDPPDYTGAAEAQGQSGKENLAQQTYANRPTQTTPWGTTSYTTGSTTDPGTGIPVTTWNQNTALTPGLQNALNDQINITAGRSGAANTLLGQATGAFQTPFNWAGMPARGNFTDVGYQGPDYFTRTQVGRPDFDASTARNRAEEALFQRQKNLIEPGLTESEAARRTRLANMGITPEGGSEAWNRAQTSMDSARNQAYENAALNAITGGGAEATREMGMAQGEQGMDIARTGANIGLEQGRLNLATGFTDTMNRQRQQAIAEQALQRGMPLNELNALLTQQQVSMPQMPNFTQAGVAPATPYVQAATAQGENPGGTDWGTLLGTAAKVGMVAAASDRRLKRNITALGGGWYVFNYLWDNVMRVGVMAQEVLATKPEAVIVGPGGYLLVDYSKL